jgi:hypothetical protein
MASIKTRIEIEGGDEVRAGLKALGAEGQEAFKKITDGTKGLGTGLGEFRSNLQKVEAQARSFGAALRDVSDNAVKFGREMGKAAQGVALIGGALAAATKQTADAADAQEDGAQQAGVSVEAYGRLRYAFTRAAGGAESADRAITQLNDALREGGDTKQAKALQQLGVQIVRLGNGAIDTEATLGNIAEAFRKLPDGVVKSQLAIDLFGKRVGPGLIPLLNEGRAGLQNLGDEATRMGAVFDKDAAAKGAKFNDTLTKLQTSLAGVRNAFTVPFFEPFTAAMNSAAEGLAALQPAIRDVATLVRDVLTAAFKGLAAVVVPVIQAVGKAVDALLSGINKLFGTNITKEHLIVVAAFVAITLAVVKLAAAIGTMFPILSGLVKLFTGIPAILTAIVTGVKLMGTAFIALTRGVSLAISILTGLNPVTLIILAIIAAIVLLILYWPQISAAAKDAWDTISKAAADMWAKIKDYWNKGIEFFESLFTAEFWEGVWESAKQAAFDAWESIKSAFQTALDTIWKYLENTWLGKVISAISAAIDKARELWNWLMKTEQATPGAANGGQVVAAAGGGYIRGPGSGTSDSINARLSNGEFVQRAKAVKHYGVDFMRAINSLRLPKLPGFSMGGLVGELMPPLPVPGFASGGLVGAPAGGGGRPVILNMPGGESFNLTASDGTVDNLTRYANRQIVRGAGRRPTWYKG